MMRNTSAQLNLAAALGALLFALACSADRDANDDYRACKDKAGCEEGETCYRGYCLSEGSSMPNEDGGMPDANAQDANVPDADSGPDEDAGEPAAEPCPGMEGMERLCYDGEGDPVGECQTGTSICAGGVWGRCIGQRLPTDEICNNDDDDCDEATDEDLELATCDTAMEGECAVGLLVCGAGAAICQQTVMPAAEGCDAKDNDCDGAIDEGEIGEAACYTGNLGCMDDDNDGVFACSGTCRAGIQTCVNGETQPCIGEVLPGDESCDKQPGPGNTMIAADEDCDGMTDEGCNCTENDTQDCYDGPNGTAGVGECALGEQVCTSAGAGTAWTSCLGSTTPEAETCANPGEDNDCNDDIDDVPTLDTPCTDPEKVGRCKTGVRQCVDDELTCVTPEPRDEETCDSTDDDCDGRVDEGFNLQNDELNCGSCGNPCGEGETCCAGNCVNTNTDKDYCGSCDDHCGSGLTCCGGNCVDTLSNLSHCGGCGRSCTGLGQCCQGGMCKSLLCL